MLPLVVRVENLETQSAAEHVFDRSPIHIGRNKLNDLPLADGFVSLWHAILRFDETTMEYLDLDSTNGTEVDGQPVRRNVFVPVREDSDLRIGSLRLHISRSEAAAAPPPTMTLFGRRTTQFAFRQREPEPPLPASPMRSEPAAAAVQPASEPAGPALMVRAGGIGGAQDQTDALGLLRIFASTYGPESAQLFSTEDVRRFLDQLAATLETFGKAFLELRRGHDQFGKEIAVPMASEQTPLRHAKTPRDLLRFLLEFDGRGADRLRPLHDGFADVMIHQVALLNGVRQGIAALLKYLGPEELERSSSAARNGAGLALLRIWPVRAATLWRAYLARHHELLQEEKAVQSIVFGSEFAFAYAQIVGGNYPHPVPEARGEEGRSARVGD